MSEVNIKEIEFLSDDNNILVKKIKPNFKTLGPKYGKMMKAIAEAIANFSQNDITRIENEKEINLTVENQNITICLSDVEIVTDDIPGWIVANEDAITVALDITIDEQLRYEGIARELVNRIQNIRKESDFDVVDKIDVRLSYHPEMENVLHSFKTYICSETLCNRLELIDNFTSEQQVELSDTITLDIEIEKSK